MKLTLVALVTFLGVAMAAGKLPNGANCKKDGSMGACQSGFCLQESDKDSGKCADSK